MELQIKNAKFLFITQSDQNVKGLEYLTVVSVFAYISKPKNFNVYLK